MTSREDNSKAGAREPKPRAGGPAKIDRKARAAEALRENLKRRKQQRDARKTAGRPPGAEPQNDHETP